VVISKDRKVEDIVNILEKLYPKTPIPLKHMDPFTLLVSVVLSAQCTDERVNQITPILFDNADTPLKMSRLPVGKIENIIRPCGLSPQKSKAISGLSKLIVNNHNSKVPQNFKDLENLPGVGHKTASVVMSQAFGYPAFPVDTHIHRLAWRWGLSTGKNVEKTEKDLKRLFPESKWNKLHLQIIFYGREYCPARGHKLEVCIICSKYKRKEGFK
jgi:endonuclease-3